VFRLAISGLIAARHASYSGLDNPAGAAA
jgi:hypothetical protein